MIFEYEGREIEMQFHGVQDDIQCTYAKYTDNNEDVPDEAVDLLMDSYASEIDQEAWENACSAAETYFEGDR